MAKLYPFKYRFENPGITPLKDDLWFESHQELLLRIVNTPQGRDLLCIDKDFDGVEIVRFGKNYVTGFLGFDGDRARLVSDFRTGAKWANVIRFRWREFQALAKEHYSDKVNGQTEILLNGQYRMAATTSTFYPAPSPDPPVDGWALRDNGGNESWSDLRTGVGTSANDSSAFTSGPYFIAGTISDNYKQLRRNIHLFNCTSLGGDIVDSAIFSIWVTSLLNSLSGANSDNSKMVLASSNPASNSALIAADYGQLGSIDFGRSVKQSSLTTGAYNGITLNANGLANITAGISKFGEMYGWDFDNTTAGLTWASGNQQGIQPQYAETAGTEQDPKLVVIHSSAGIVILRRRMEGY